MFCLSHKFLFMLVSKTSLAATQRMLEPYFNMLPRLLWRSIMQHSISNM